MIVLALGVGMQPETLCVSMGAERPRSRFLRLSVGTIRNV